MQRHTARGNEAGHEVVVETINALEIPWKRLVAISPHYSTRVWISHLASSPLHFLHNIQAAMHDELVHMSSLLCESGYTVASLLRAPKLIFK